MISLSQEIVDIMVSLNDVCKLDHVSARRMSLSVPTEFMKVDIWVLSKNDEEGRLIWYWK